VGVDLRHAAGPIATCQVIGHLHVVVVLMGVAVAVEKSDAFTAVVWGWVANVDVSFRGREGQRR
jgi:hypothetical protein